MKKTVFLAVLVVFALLLFACGDRNDTDSQSSNFGVSSADPQGENTSDTSRDISSAVSEGSDEGSGEVSSDSSAEASADTSEGEESKEEKYPFLHLEHRVTAKTESNDIKYTYTYYIEEDSVVGAMLVTTLQNEEFASLYYETLASDYDYAQLDGCDVTVFFDEDSCVYGGFTTERLLSALDKGIYTVEEINGGSEAESRDNNG